MTDTYGSFHKRSKSKMSKKLLMVTGCNNRWTGIDDHGDILVTHVEVTKNGMPIGEPVTQRFWAIARRGSGSRVKSFSDFTRRLSRAVNRPEIYKCEDPLDSIEAVTAVRHLYGMPFWAWTAPNMGTNDVPYEDIIEFAEEDPNDPIPELLRDATPDVEDMKKEPEPEPTPEPKPEPEPIVVKPEPILNTGLAFDVPESLKTLHSMMLNDFRVIASSRGRMSKDTFLNIINEYIEHLAAILKDINNA